jgi:hypothetical protein
MWTPLPDAMRHHRLALAFEGDRWTRFGLEKGLHRRVGVGSDQNFAGFRLAAQPSANVHRVARNLVDAARIDARRKEDRSGVHSGVHLESPAELTLHAATQLIDALVKRHRRVDGAHGVVSVGAGHPKDHHDLVAHDLVNQAAVLIRDVTSGL